MYYYIFSNNPFLLATQFIFIRLFTATKSKGAVSDNFSQFTLFRWYFFHENVQNIFF